MYITKQFLFFKKKCCKQSWVIRVCKLFFFFATYVKLMAFKTTKPWQIGNTVLRISFYFLSETST